MEDKRVTKGQETYHRLMMSAIEIVSEEGVAGITASKLSSRAGVSKSTIFHHFESTGDIPIAVLKKIMEEMTLKFEVNDDMTVEMFIEILDSMLFQEDEMTLKLQSAFFSFYSEGLFGEVYKKMLTEFLNESEIIFTKALMACVNNKRSLEEVKYYSRLIIACLDGIGLHLLIEGQADIYIQCWHIQKDLIIHGLTQ